MSEKYYLIDVLYPTLDQRDQSYIATNVEKIIEFVGGDGDLLPELEEMEIDWEMTVQNGRTLAPYEVDIDQPYYEIFTIGGLP